MTFAPQTESPHHHVTGPLAEPPFPGSVFLSYASADKQACSTIVDFATALGHDVWFDRDLPGGRISSHEPPIAERIERCDTFLMLLSPDSLRSSHVLWEWLCAFGSRDPVDSSLEEGSRQRIQSLVVEMVKEEHLSSRPHHLRAVLHRPHEKDDLGKFNHLWEGAPQFRDWADAHQDPTDAAWQAALELSPQGDALKSKQREARLDLTDSLKALRDRPAGLSERDLVERVVRCLTRVWLGNRGIVAGPPGQLDLRELLEVSAPPGDMGWSSFKSQMGHCLSAGQPGTLRPFRSMGRDLDEALGEYFDAVDKVEGGRHLSRYALLPRATPDETMPAQLCDWLPAALERHALTFLVGPDAVHVGPEELVLDKTGVLREAKSIAAGFRKSDKRKGEPPILLPVDGLDRFFDSLIDTNVGGRAFEDEGEELTAGWAADGRRTKMELCGRLLLLAHTANRIFVDKRSQGQTPVAAEGWVEPVCLGTEQVEQLTRQIDKVPPALKTWSTDTAATGTYSATLGAKALIRSLTRFRKSIDPAPSKSPVDAPLSYEGVQWLADIFWHSLVHDLPVYPTASELDIQASLVHDSAQLDNSASLRNPYGEKEPARSEYSQIWPTRDVEGLAEAVRQALTPTWETRPRCRAFYAHLARVLYEQHDRGFQPPAGPRTDSRTPPLALAVSSSFDMELETALATSARLHPVFHVVFPVVVVQADEAPREWGDWRWAMGTFQGTSDEASALSPRRWTLLDARMDAPVIRGPIVVKTNGAPLIDIPIDLEPVSPDEYDADDDPFDELDDPLPRDGAAVEARHVLPLALGDYDNMQFVMIDLIANSREPSNKDRPPQAAMPKWLTHQLMLPDRKWLGLGLSDHEWNARMQLFVLATRAGARGGWAALVADKRPSRDVFMRSCGIKPVWGTLEQMAEILEENQNGVGR